MYVCTQVDESDADTEAEISQLEQQIDMCNTQISDLQQKLIDADQGLMCAVTPTKTLLIIT